jgi:hypothetical protein
MALIEDPPKPLRDVRLNGVLLSLARIMGVVRIVAGVVLAVTYFQTWQVIAGASWTGYQMANGSPVPVIAAAGVSALGYFLLRSPTLSRGMISAAGSVVLALVIARLTRNQTSAPLETIQLKGAQILFGFTFIVLTFTGFSDLIFHPILYMWQRRGEK